MFIHLIEFRRNRDVWQPIREELHPGVRIEVKGFYLTHSIAEVGGNLLDRAFLQLMIDKSIPNSPKEVKKNSNLLFARFRVNGDVFDILTLGGKQTILIS